MFAYQPKFNMLELKEDKSTEYVIGWKSKEVYSTKFFPLHCLSPIIKYFECKIGL